MASNYCHGGTREVQHGRKRIFERTEVVPSQSQLNETEIDNAVKKLRGNESTECLLDRLPEELLHEVLSRLSITELLKARRTCVSWHRMISSCNIFQQLYDERNKESWIALSSDHRGFCFFNNNSNKRYFFLSRYEADQTKSWLLQGAADGILLLVANDGEMLAGNALTRRFRKLPDTRVSTRLSLKSCLKKKLWPTNSTPETGTVQPSISINLVVDDGGKTFKVMVWGELRTAQVHALVYSSATEQWTVRLCPNISYRLFRQPPFHTTVDGSTIVYSSMKRSVLANYDTETGVFNEIPCALQERQWGLGIAVHQIQYIKLLVYKGRTFMLSVLVGRRVFIGRPLIGQSCALMVLWLANPTVGQWELSTTHELQLQFASQSAAGLQLAAAYDGKDSVTIIPRMRGSKMISLNLDTRAWSVLDADTQAWVLADENAQQRTEFSIRAFHLKLKFCTANWLSEQPLPLLRLFFVGRFYETLSYA